MGFIPDIIIIAIAVLAAYIGWKSGFAKNLVSFLGFFISVFGGVLLSPHLAEVIFPMIREALAKSSSMPEGLLAGEGLESLKIMAEILAFLIIFMLVTILVIIVKGLIQKLFKYPTLKKADSLLGMLLGLCLSIIIINALCLGVFTAFSVMGELYQVQTPEMLENSIIAKWIYEHNILGFVLNLLK